MSHSRTLLGGLFGDAAVDAVFSDEARLQAMLDVERALAQLLGDPERRERMTAAGRALVETGRGALARTLNLLQPLLPPAV